MKSKDQPAVNLCSLEFSSYTNSEFSHTSADRTSNNTLAIESNTNFSEVPVLHSTSPLGTNRESSSAILSSTEDYYKTTDEFPGLQDISSSGLIQPLSTDGMDASIDKEEKSVAFTKIVEDELRKHIEALELKLDTGGVDYDIASTEISLITSALSNMQESDILFELHQKVANLNIKLNKSGKKIAKRTESTVVETGSSDIESPIEKRFSSLSDLLEPQDLNRENIDEEFEVLAAEVVDTYEPICSSPSNLSTLLAFPPSTERKSGMKLVCGS